MKSLEQRLLSLCLHPPNDPVASKEIPVLLARAIDWEHLVYLSGRNDVTALVHQCLTKYQSLVPVEVIAQLRYFQIQTSSWNLALAVELLTVLDIFAQAGIDAVVFKGPALSVLLYGQLKLRQCRDLDLLLERKSVWSAVSLLIHRGYRLISPDVPIDRDRILESRKDVGLEHSGTGIYIELHWAICEPEFDERLFQANLWRETQTIHLLGSPMKIPAWEYLVLLLSIHGERHYWNSLKWICDIDRLIRQSPELSWNRVLRIAEAYEARRMVLTALKTSCDLLSTPLPASVDLREVQAIDNLSLQRNLFSVRDELFVSHDETLLSSTNAAQMDLSKKVSRLCCQDTFRRRLWFVCTLVADFTRPEPEDYKRFPRLAQLTPLFWIIQPFRLLRAHGVLFFLRASTKVFSCVLR